MMPDLIFIAEISMWRKKFIVALRCAGETSVAHAVHFCTVVGRRASIDTAASPPPPNQHTLVYIQKQ